MIPFDPRRAFRQAAKIERDLRDRGVPSIEIPGILGAAFMASLTNLPPGDRAQAVGAHLVALQAVYGEIRTAMQAPDGPMPGLGRANT